MISEINYITDKIYVAIAKKSKEEARISEINSKKNQTTDIDIVGDVGYTKQTSTNDDVSIY